MPMSVGAVVFVVLAFQILVWEMCVWMTGREQSGGRA